MSFSEGEIVSGKVTGITKFGAFVALEDGKSGLVHISEIADSYVSDVRQYLTEGQEVRVKILPTDKAGRINLSIKKAAAPQAQRAVPQPVAAGVSRHTSQSAGGDSFEDKLRAFMKDSENKMSAMKNPPEKKGGMPRRMRTKQ